MSSAGFPEHTFALSVYRCAQYAHRVLSEYDVRTFWAKTHFVHTLKSPENTLCVLLQGLDTLCAYLWRLLAPFEHTSCLRFVASGPIEHTFPAPEHTS